VRASASCRARGPRARARPALEETIATHRIPSAIRSPAGLVPRRRSRLLCRVDVHTRPIRPPRAAGRTAPERGRTADGVRTRVGLGASGEDIADVAGAGRVDRVRRDREARARARHAHPRRPGDARGRSGFGPRPGRGDRRAVGRPGVRRLSRAAAPRRSRRGHHRDSGVCPPGAGRSGGRGASARAVREADGQHARRGRRDARGVRARRGALHGRAQPAVHAALHGNPRGDRPRRRRHGPPRPRERAASPSPGGTHALLHAAALERGSGAVARRRSVQRHPRDGSAPLVCGRPARRGARRTPSHDRDEHQGRARLHHDRDPVRRRGDRVRRDPQQPSARLSGVPPMRSLRHPRRDSGERPRTGRSDELRRRRRRVSRGPGDPAPQPGGVRARVGRVSRRGRGARAAADAGRRGARGPGAGARA